MLDWAQNIYDHHVFTFKDFQEHLPVTGDVDVLLIDVIIQKHRAWVLPGLLPESKPVTHGATHILFVF